MSIMRIISCIPMIKSYFIFSLLLICSTLKAENYFTSPLKKKGFRFLVEAGMGYNHYSSPGGLYRVNQSVYYASGILGYEKKSLFLGIGGTTSRHTKDNLYSFKAFLNTRYIFKNILLAPYGEILGGVVGYLKWNDFVKPYYAIGAGIHVLPRLCTGLRIANVGTLDNQKSWEYSIYFSFIIGK